MSDYLKWFSVAGVWYPAAFLAAWFSVAATLSVFGAPDSAGGMYLIGIFLIFPIAHSFGLASLLAAGLFVTRQVQVSPFRLFTALIGALVAIFVLARVYFNVGVLSS
jgi:hypothetical protein